MFFTQLQLSIMAENKRRELWRIGTGAWVWEGGEGRVDGGGSWKGWEEKEKARSCMVIQQQCLIFCSPKGLWEGSQEKRSGSRKVPPSKISSSLICNDATLQRKNSWIFSAPDMQDNSSPQIKVAGTFLYPYPVLLLLMRSPWKPVRLLKMTYSLSAIL